MHRIEPTLPPSRLLIERRFPLEMNVTLPEIRELYDSGKAGSPYAVEFYRDEYLLNAYIKHYPKPYIALISGIVMGGAPG